LEELIQFFQPTAMRKLFNCSLLFLFSTQQKSLNKLRHFKVSVKNSTVLLIKFHSPYWRFL